MKKILVSIIYLFIVLAMISCGGNSSKQLTDQDPLSSKGVDSVKLLTDREILMKIYEAMNGPEWDNTYGRDWGSDEPIEDWNGVGVNDEGRVNVLFMHDSNVRGLIPAEIGGLTELSFLNIHMSCSIQEERTVFPNLTNLVNLKKLEMNGFGGAIPENIGQLTKLQYLSLNGFEGEIPESICELAELEELILETDNQPVGAVPDCIGRLSKLKKLFIEYKTETEGEIKQANAKFPESIWDLTNLEMLSLCSLSNTGGPIPGDKVSKMTNLIHIKIADCGISGRIPVEFFESGKLMGLRINKNKLTGSIPSEIGNCLNLYYLNLSQNQLTGNIPEELANFKRGYIEGFDLSGNQLSPDIPAALKEHPSFSKFKF